MKMFVIGLLMMQSVIGMEKEIARANSEPKKLKIVPLNIFNSGDLPTSLPLKLHKDESSTSSSESRGSFSQLLLPSSEAHSPVSSTEEIVSIDSLKMLKETKDECCVSDAGTPLLTMGSNNAMSHATHSTHLPLNDQRLTSVTTILSKEIMHQADNITQLRESVGTLRHEIRFLKYTVAAFVFAQCIQIALKYRT